MMATKELVFANLVRVAFRQRHPAQCGTGGLGDTDWNGRRLAAVTEAAPFFSARIRPACARQRHSLSEHTDLALRREAPIP
jgi:hypothetical protein